MSVYYNPCGVALPDYVCAPCGITNKEKGRVRSLFFVSAAYYGTLMTDPTNPVIWANGVASKDIIVVPQTQGSFNGGTPIKEPGYGDQKEVITGYDFQIQAKDPNYNANTMFYDAIASSNQWHVGWRSSSKSKISGVPATIAPSAPIDDDINATVEWNLDITFTEANHQAPFNAPATVFKCPN
jgi:hypothetical protein